MQQFYTVVISKREKTSGNGQISWEQLDYDQMNQINFQSDVMVS